jgi:S-adenosyl-L-methionine hydrolase (adenosine-forming)
MTGQIVTLLTDFGTKDGYIGSVKGVIKSYYPKADIIDISHDIEPFDIRSAAFTLHNYYSFYPKDTIHMVVIDPGVGSIRRPLLVRTAQHYFVGPDNGVFQFIFNREAYTAYELDIQKINPQMSSSTFHARDVFAPAVGKILQGKNCDQIGVRLDERTEIPSVFYQKDDESGKLVLEAVSIDRFGNIITGFSRRDMERMNKYAIDQVKVKDFTTNTLNSFYAEKDNGQIMALWNSMEFLEIAAVNASAAQILNFNKKKDFVTIKIR